VFPFIRVSRVIQLKALVKKEFSVGTTTSIPVNSMAGSLNRNVCSYGGVESLDLERNVELLLVLHSVAAA
jgi:hypothetical protein